MNVIAWVTDKKGRPIKGLTQEDFELYENGRQVNITNFFEVETGTPVRPTTERLDPGDQVDAEGTIRVGPAALVDRIFDFRFSIFD